MTVKYREVVEGSIVQLGRLNKERKALSYAQAYVLGKSAVKVGNNVTHSIQVQVGPRERAEVHLHNIREILA